MSMNIDRERISCTRLECSYEISDNGSHDEDETGLYFTVAFNPNSRIPIFILETHMFRRRCGEGGANCIHIPMDIGQVRFLFHHNPDSAVWHRGGMTARYEGCTLVLRMDYYDGGEAHEIKLTCQERFTLKDIIANVSHDIEEMGMYIRGEGEDRGLHVVRDRQALKRLAMMHAQDVHERSYNEENMDDDHDVYDDVSASTFKTFLEANGLTVSDDVHMDGVLSEARDTVDDFTQHSTTPTGLILKHRARCESCAWVSEPHEEMHEDGGDDDDDVDDDNDNDDNSNFEVEVSRMEVCNPNNLARTIAISENVVSSTSGFADDDDHDGGDIVDSNR